MISGGLSPRVRGNHGLREGLSVADRSIPACTGEPPANVSPQGQDTVYPRVYGGTITHSPLAFPCMGLSPRVRGNPFDGGPPDYLRRSIPACTGEPGTGYGRVNARQVYPRVYGGTLTWTGAAAPSVGLSPRVRGNRAAGLGVQQQRRSIPACTGEPHLRRSVQGAARVYPRVYGGTLERVSGSNSYQGLSPRVRGNLAGRRCGNGGPGSIPACTGEPACLPTRGPASAVYPRVYGGTNSPASVMPPYTGLSPRVRGNHVQINEPDIRIRSIPACTGEPRS